MVAGNTHDVVVHPLKPFGLQSKLVVDMAMDVVEALVHIAAQIVNAARPLFS
jgi:hypothetical protein